MRRSLWALVIAVPLIAVLGTGFGRDPSAIVSPLLNNPAPSFSLRSLGGKEVSLKRLKGRPVVVNFWASWCTGCKYEHPYLLDAWRTYQPQGVTFVGVVYQDSSSGAKAFMQRNGGSWPVLRDPNQQTAVDYGVIKLPETYFINRRGIVTYKAMGPVTPQLLNQQIGGLLRRQA